MISLTDHFSGEGRLRNLAPVRLRINCSSFLGVAAKTFIGSPVTTFPTMRFVYSCGVSFMENQMAWHYLPMNEEQYQQAVQEVTECGKLSATV